MPEPVKKAAAKKAPTTPSTPVGNPGENGHPNLAAALSAFQAEVISVHKGKTAEVVKDGRKLYAYDYADLADVTLAALPRLAAHGLSFTTRPAHLDGVGFVLEGVLRHTSGGEDVGCLPIQGRDAQAIGSSLTYNRRYLLGCMTGIVTDDDDDGSRAAAARTERPASEPAPSTPPPVQAQRAEHVQMVVDVIHGLTEAERAQVGPWWENATRDGHLPPRTNLDALTPAQAVWVRDTVAHMRDVAAAELTEEAAERERLAMEHARETEPHRMAQGPQ